MSELTPRILKEIKNIETKKIPGVEIEQSPINSRHFFIKFDGPKDSPYEGGIFNAELYLTPDYPMSPPKFLLTTKIYHPNFDNLGRNCLDILADKWSPALQISSVVLSVQALLACPNPDDPLNNEVSHLWKSDLKSALSKAKEYTTLYAKK